PSPLLALLRRSFPAPHPHREGRNQQRPDDECVEQHAEGQGEADLDQRVQPGQHQCGEGAGHDQPARGDGPSRVGHASAPPPLPPPRLSPVPRAPGPEADFSRPPPRPRGGKTETPAPANPPPPAAGRSSSGPSESSHPGWPDNSAEPSPADRPPARSGAP